MQVQEKPKRLWVALFGTLVIAGCSSTATEPVVEQQPVTEIAEVVEVVEVIEEAGPGFAADNKTPVDASGNPVSRTFYFDFDIIDIKLDSPWIAIVFCVSVFLCSVEMVMKSLI